jgi:spore coat polysaccharide biosynthesis protein SpsF
MTETKDPLREWQGAFGDDYIARNDATGRRIDVAERLLGGIFAKLNPPPESVLEVGCNVGINLRAIGRFSPAKLHGLEPSPAARRRLLDDGVLPAERILDGHGGAIPMADGAVDLAFTSGVLIHVPPAKLAAVVREVHRVTRKYILLLEYFARNPEQIEYRGKTGMLFKRDFGAFYLDTFPDLEVVADGFFWRRTTGADDLTWCLLRKTY